MRIVIISVGGRGDVQPYVALGSGLRAAGYRVRLATNPEFESLAQAYGLDFFPININIRAMLENPQGQALLGTGHNPLNFMRELARNMGPLLEQGVADCWQACQSAEVVIFSTTGFLLGYHVAEKLKLPYLEAMIFPVTPTRAFPSGLFPTDLRLGGLFNLFTYWASDFLTWQLFKEPINAARKKVLALPPTTARALAADVIENRRPVLYGYSPAVLPKPVDWASWIQVTGYWFLDSPASWSPPKDLVDFLGAGPPPVYLGFGSMGSHASKELNELAVQACTRAGQRGLLAAGWSDLESVERLRSKNIFVIESVPHAWLFPRMAAVVHHGGAGTTAAGFRAGVPTVIIPFLADQPFWGRRAHELGVSPPPIPRRKLTLERLAAAITTATSDEQMRQRAAALGEKIRAEDGRARAAEIFESHFSRSD
jgi:sterol 3beta-glucosyltransferase